MNIKTIMEEERQKLKDATPRQKLQHFLEYYKWPAIAAVIVLAIIGSFVHSAVTAKDVVLSGICLNCYQSSFETHFEGLTDGFLQTRQLDSGKYAVELNSSLVYAPGEESAAQDNFQTVQRIGAQITAGGLDFVVGNLEAVADFAYSGTFCDLSEILSEEGLQRYEACILYVDMAFAQQDSAPQPASSPEGMDQPVPVMIDVSGCALLMENYPYLGEPLVLAAAVNAPNADNVRALIDYLMDN